jgi:lysophospholipase L1-like esterase
MGKPDNSYGDNNNRNKLNELIRKEYACKNHLFDLAALESTFIDGRRAVYQSEGQSFEMLVPKYTDDGGHLNEKGQRIIAEQFLIFLTSL